MGRPRKDGTPAARPGEAKTAKVVDPAAPVIVKVKLAPAEFARLTAEAEKDFRNPEMMATVLIMRALRRMGVETPADRTIG